MERQQQRHSSRSIHYNNGHAIDIATDQKLRTHTHTFIHKYIYNEIRTIESSSENANALCKSQFWISQSHKNTNSSIVYYYIQQFQQSRQQFNLQFGKYYDGESDYLLNCAHSNLLCKWRVKIKMQTEFAEAKPNIFTIS